MNLSRYILPTRRERSLLLINYLSMTFFLECTFNLRPSYTLMSNDNYRKKLAKGKER